MPVTDDILLEDWTGLESETERLYMVYGYPLEEPEGFVIWVNAEDDRKPRDTDARETRS